MRRILRGFTVLALLPFAGLVATRANAAVPYPVPHRSWNRVGAVAYEANPTQAEIDWAAQNIDWFDNPHSIGAYQAETDATKLCYVETCSVYAYDANDVFDQGDWMWCCWRKWCDQQIPKVDYEEAFLHTSSGARVQIVYDGSTQRYVCNPRSANYRKFWTYFANVATTSDQDGGTYDGIFVDDAFPGVLNQQAGGPSDVREYPGVTDVSAAFDVDMLQVYDAVRAGLGPRGGVGSKHLSLNVANYVPDNMGGALPYADSFFRERVFVPANIYADRFQRTIDAMATARAGGVANIFSTGGTSEASGQLLALAAFYVAANPQVDMFCEQDSNNQDLRTTAWFGALGYDVGQPEAPYYTISPGVYARQFTKVLVIANVSGDATTISLPKGDNPTGVYYAVGADGTRSSAQLTQITLADGEGALLAKASALTSSVPVASFTATPSAGPAPLQVRFLDTSTGLPTSWAWDFGDDATATTQNPIHAYASVGTYTVTLDAANGLGSSRQTASISVTQTLPTAAFTGTPTSGPAPLTVSFVDASTNAPTAWSWTFGDGTTSAAQSPTHQYAAGTFTVSLRATNAGGSTTLTRPGYIIAGGFAPVAAFSASPTSGAAPLTVQFTDTSTGSPTAWLWTFGDGATSSAQSPSHQYGAGVFTVSLRATSAVGPNTLTKVGYIVASGLSPVADFVATPTLGPAPLVVQFVDTSTGTITLWTWSFGDGATSTLRNPSHTYAVGAYTVSLTATGPGGANTAVKTGYIAASVPAPGTAFVASPTSGPEPLAVQFTDTSTGSPTRWAWDFGDGGSSTAQSPLHTYLAGIYTVGLTAANAGGSNSAVRSDYIVAQGDSTPPATDFTAIPVSGVAPLSVQFFDTSTGTPVAWAWSFGDGATAAEQTPTHTYAPGTYTVTLTATNAAGPRTASKTDYVTARAPSNGPKASFAASPTRGVLPLAVGFMDTSSGDLTSWDWSFGDGTGSTERSPDHLYGAARHYSVALTVRGPDGSDQALATHYVLVTYLDVPLDYWALNEIIACADAGINNGYPDGTYRPLLTATRDAMAVYFARGLSGGLVPPGPTTATYPDVPIDYWAYDDIEYLTACGVVTGYPDGTYQPGRTIDRGQLAVYVARAIASPTGETGLTTYVPPTEPSFTDVPVGFWAYRYIEYCRLEQVVRGYEDGSYRPAVLVTRDQLAVYVERSFQLPMS